MQNYTLALRHAWNRVNSLPNVVGVGIGYKEKANERTDKLALIIFVSRKVPEHDLTPTEIVPRAIAKVETDVVEIGEVRLLSLRTTRVRPAQPGVSIGHYKITAGTLGALVKDARSGAQLILSNNHILANSSNGEDSRARVGDPIYQPGPYDGGTSDDTIARLERFIPVITEYQESTCPIGRRLARTQNFFVHLLRPNYEVRFHKRNSDANLVDCAVARPISDRLVTPEILEVGPVRGVAEAKLGETLIKSGRTSGLTRGKVTALSATLRIQMHSGVYALFTDQVVADLKSQGGDSGSLVLNEQNEAVGLLFAGSDRSTILNRIQNVMDKLGITF